MRSVASTFRLMHNALLLTQYGAEALTASLERHSKILYGPSPALQSDI